MPSAVQFLRIPPNKKPNLANRPSPCQTGNNGVQNSLFRVDPGRYFEGMDLGANLASIQQRMAAACQRARRPADSVTLLPVTKGQGPDVVAEAARLGLNVFGENK